EGGPLAEAVADDLANRGGEVHHPPAAECAEDSVVEGHGAAEVGALDGEVVEQGGTHSRGARASAWGTQREVSEGAAPLTRRRRTAATTVKAPRACSADMRASDAGAGYQ